MWLRAHTGTHFVAVALFDGDHLPPLDWIDVPGVDWPIAVTVDRRGPSARLILQIDTDRPPAGASARGQIVINRMLVAEAINGDFITPSRDRGGYFGNARFKPIELHFADTRETVDGTLIVDFGMSATTATWSRSGPEGLELESVHFTCRRRPAVDHHGAIVRQPLVDSCIFVESCSEDFGARTAIWIGRAARERMIEVGAPADTLGENLKRRLFDTGPTALRPLDGRWPSRPGGAPFADRDVVGLFLLEVLRAAREHLNHDRQPDDPTRAIRRICFTAPPTFRAADVEGLEHAFRLAARIAKIGVDGVELVCDEGSAITHFWMLDQVVEPNSGTGPVRALQRLAQAHGTDGDEGLRVMAVDLGGSTTDIVLNRYRWKGTRLDTGRPMFIDGFASGGVGLSRELADRIEHHVRGVDDRSSLPSRSRHALEQSRLRAAESLKRGLSAAQPLEVRFDDAFFDSLSEPGIDPFARWRGDDVWRGLRRMPGGRVGSWHLEHDEILRWCRRWRPGQQIFEYVRSVAARHRPHVLLLSGRGSRLRLYKSMLDDLDCEVIYLNTYEIQWLGNAAHGDIDKRAASLGTAALILGEHGGLDNLRIRHTPHFGTARFLFIRDDQSKPILQPDHFDAVGGDQSVVIDIELPEGQASCQIIARFHDDLDAPHVPLVEVRRRRSSYEAITCRLEVCRDAPTRLVNRSPDLVRLEAVRFGLRSRH